MFVSVQMNFADSQTSSINTPLPVYRAAAPEAGVSVSDAPSVASSLVRIFKERNIILDTDAAELLAEEATVDGSIIDAVIDNFYAAVETRKLSHVTQQIALRLLRTVTSCASRIKILNAFVDFPHFLWDDQQQKYIRRDISEGSGSLLPDTTMLYSASKQRYYRAIHRLKMCPKVAWWSEAHVLQRMALTSGDKLVVRPAECAKGLTGTLSVVGVLRCVFDEASDQQSWILEDGCQRFFLDLSQCSTHDQLFLQSNIIVVTGDIDSATGVLHAKEIAHPPIADDRDGDITDLLWKKQNTAHRPWANTFPSCSTRTEQRIPATPEPAVPGASVWLVFGICHLDDGTVISNIYRAMCNYDPRVLAGIILTGEFYSKPFNPSAKSQYAEGFGELLDAIKLWKEKIGLRSKAQDPLRLILVPALNDAGPRFLPKLPLLGALVTEPHAKHLDELKDSVEWILASNPLRVETSYAESLSAAGAASSESEQHTMLVCRGDLTRDIDTLRLALKTPFEQPLYPSAAELINTIPNLLAGQAHVYPVPFKTPHVVRIAPGYDYALELPSLPNIVILSDTGVPYVTFWEQRCWFSCPGHVADGHFLAIDTRRNCAALQQLPEQDVGPGCPDQSDRTAN